jgi:hypothetical protein
VLLYEKTGATTRDMNDFLKDEEIDATSQGTAPLLFDQDG